MHPEPLPSSSHLDGPVVPANSQPTIPTTSNDNLSLPTMQAFLLVPSGMSVQYGASQPQLMQTSLYQLVQQGRFVQLSQTSTPPVQQSQPDGLAGPFVASQPSQGPSNSTPLAPLTLYPVTLGSSRQEISTKTQPTHEANKDQAQTTVTTTPCRVSRRMKGKMKA
ncbi:hypothetical protein FS749_014499 [Ceratobasidium sp. UAMH 11750]|nr:hypothetical protein FS749_014499 [Ceratobasidium sp. UAMH 11750]